ncbi:Uncharacterised protein [Klebsiella michiganensis]|nr:Uncharacterised protein [Klebsiella michiganensis]
MPGCQSGFAMKLPGSSPLTNGTMIDTKTLCSRLLPFQTGKIVLHNLKLKAERILTHKKTAPYFVGSPTFWVQFTMHPAF